MDVISLTLDVEHAAIVHSLLELHYVECLTVAEQFERTADLNDPVMRRIMENYRDEAERTRHIGQALELLAPGLEPANWRWPRATGGL